MIEIMMSMGLMKTEVAQVEYCCSLRTPHQ